MAALEPQSPLSSELVPSPSKVEAPIVKTSGRKISKTKGILSGISDRITTLVEHFRLFKQERFIHTQINKREQEFRQLKNMQKNRDNAVKNFVSATMHKDPEKMNLTAKEVSRHEKGIHKHINKLQENPFLKLNRQTSKPSERTKSVLPNEEDQMTVLLTQQIRHRKIQLRTRKIEKINRTIEKIETEFFPLNDQQKKTWQVVLEDDKCLKDFNDYLREAEGALHDLDKQLAGKKPLKIHLRREDILGSILKSAVNISRETGTIIQGSLLLFRLRQGALQNYQLVCDSMTLAVEPLKKTLEQNEDTYPTIQRHSNILKSHAKGGDERNKLTPAEKSLADQGYITVSYPGVWGKTSWDRSMTHQSLFYWKGGFAIPATDGSNHAKTSEKTATLDCTSLIKEMEHPQQLAICLYFNDSLQRQFRGMNHIPKKNNPVARRAISADLELWKRIDNNTSTLEDRALISENNKKIFKIFENFKQQLVRALVSSFVDIIKMHAAS